MFTQISLSYFGVFAEFSSILPKNTDWGTSFGPVDFQQSEAGLGMAQKNDDKYLQ